jgi:hypothetical protein
MIVIDDIRCRAPVNSDGSSTHVRIDWPDGHEILVSRHDAALLRDWLIETLGKGSQCDRAGVE